MSSEKMICRVCGKEYEPCRSANRTSNVFHWQEVACSPECGSVYLQRITESRKGTEDTSRKGKHKKATSKSYMQPAIEIEIETAESSDSTEDVDEITHDF